MPHWSRLIRDVPDFPRPGIVFKDITPVLADAAAFAGAIDASAGAWRAAPPDAVAGIEARGFILGAALARELGCGFVPVRKPGKLPWKTVGEEYELEYGTDRLEIHVDALTAGNRVLVVDDVLATGGTAGATTRLVERTGATVVGLAFVLELTSLAGRGKLGGRSVVSLVEY